MPRLQDARTARIQDEADKLDQDAAIVPESGDRFRALGGNAYTPAARPFTTEFQRLSERVSFLWDSASGHGGSLQQVHATLQRFTKQIRNLAPPIRFGEGVTPTVGSHPARFDGASQSESFYNGSTLYLWNPANSTWDQFSAAGNPTLLLYGNAYSSALSANTYHQADFETLGFGENLDTDSFYDAATDGTKIFFPTAGVYKVTLSTRAQYASATDASTDWLFEFRTYADGDTGGSFVDTFAIRYFLSFPSYGYTLADAGFYVEINGVTFVNVPASVASMELYVQHNNDDVGSNPTATLAWGSDYNSIHVERVSTTSI